MPSRTAKKAKKDHAAQPKAGPSTLPLAQSRIFAPFRALGLVSNEIPFAMFVHQPQGALAKPTINIITSVGRSWMMWDAERMTLVFVGEDAGERIGGLAVTQTEVFASAGNRVVRYFRGKKAGIFRSPGDGRLGRILIFGDQLLALKEDGTGLSIWDLATKELQNEITFHTSFTAAAVIHPATYLNKVLVGSIQGELQLWNTRTCSLIHTYPSAAGSSPSPVTALSQSPAIDVVGVGYLDGTVHLIDVRQGELIMQVKMDDGAITALSFRMDGPPILATASSSGAIASWDLSKSGRIIDVRRTAHEQAITGLEWAAGQPLLMSSGGDNSVKQWLFDSPTAVPRLLKHRSGHHAPPSCIRYYGEDGKQILTAGRDRSLRCTSVVRDSRSHELSQGAVAKKAHGLGISPDKLKHSPITALSSSSTRSKDWEDVLTAHQEDSIARTWRVEEKRIGPWTFEVEEGMVQAVCVTACGNFGLAGSSTGEIRMWNMQSGKERRSFSLNGLPPGNTRPKTTTAGKPKIKTPSLTKSIEAITGLVTDALNNLVIAGTLEGKLYFFDFHSTRMLHKIDLPSSITSLSLHRDSGLLCLICDDLVVRLVDVETRRIVRELRGFRGRIMDAAFSSDSRWLIASSLDSTLRTFDIPTGRLVDIFRTVSVATSVTFSPTGDFLATAHVDSLGIHLWANKAQFSDVAFRHNDEDEEIIEVGLPGVEGGGDTEELEGQGAVGAPDMSDVYTTPEQLTDGLLTLSLMPRSRWQTLLNLETIKQRNQPKEPTRAPEKAPFFLPTVSGLETRFDLSAVQSNEGESISRNLAPLMASLESEFTRRLEKEDQAGDHAAFFEYAKALSPAALDLEIRSLISLDHLGLFLHALTSRLRSHRDFEAVQALMNVFLTVHADVLVANSELKERLETLRTDQKKESKRLTELVSYAMGTLAFLRNAG